MMIDVRDHAGLVWTIAKRYARAAHGAIDIEDLAQAGWLGALRAAKTYDPALSSPGTYLWQWIRQAVQREIANRAETVRVPVHAQTRRRKRGEYARAHVMSLDVPVGDGSATHLDMLAAPEQEDVDLPSLDDLISAAPALTERQVRVLRLLAAGRDMAEIGRELGVSRERARQVYLEALRKVRAANDIEVDADDAASQSIAKLDAGRARSARAKRRAAEKAEQAA